MIDLLGGGIRNNSFLFCRPFFLFIFEMFFHLDFLLELFSFFRNFSQTQTMFNFFSDGKKPDETKHKTFFFNSPST